MATIPRHAATRNQGEPMLRFSLMLLRLVAVRDVAPVAACLPAFRLGVSRSDAGRGPTAWRGRGPPRIRGHSVFRLVAANRMPAGTYAARVTASSRSGNAR